MVKFIVVWFLVVSGARDAEKYAIPQASYELCMHRASEKKNNWQGVNTECVRGEMPVYIPK